MTMSWAQATTAAASGSSAASPAVMSRTSQRIAIAGAVEPCERCGQAEHAYRLTGHAGHHATRRSILRARIESGEPKQLNS